MSDNAPPRLTRENFRRWLKELSACQFQVLAEDRHTYISNYAPIFSCSQWRYQVYQNLARLVEILPRGRILDFGCGLGTHSYILARLGYSVIPLESVVDSGIEGFCKDSTRASQQKCDRESSMALMNSALRDVIKKPLTWYNGIDLPFAPGIFDAVLAYAVFEHVTRENFSTLIKAIHRVLKPGGYLFVFELPQKYSYAENLARLLRMPSHENLFTRREVEGLILPRGFRSAYFYRSGLIFQRPVGLSNALFPLSLILEKLLSKTPLALTYHHMEFAFTKIS